MQINGLQKLTLLDFPGKIACTVFLGGCNFRCPFCHNASLALAERVKSNTIISNEEFFDFLKKRVGILQGVCISGGEPTLYHDLPSFIKEIRKMGFSVKLDTNGYNPTMLEQIINDGIVDYIAMDIKNSKEKYALTTGIPNLDVSRIEKSAALLMAGKMDFEFRTTVVKELHDEEDIEKIGRWLCGNENYFLQTFKDSGDLIESGFSGYDEKHTNYLLNLLLKYVPNAQIRG